MRIGTLFIVALVATVCLGFAGGCGGGGAGNNVNTGTVTGEIYGAAGGAFIPLGGQTVTIGSRVAATQAGTGRFVLTGISPGAFTVEVHADAGYGEVLNPENLQGTVVGGGSKDIGRILLGEAPPNPA